MILSQKTPTKFAVFSLVAIFTWAPFVQTSMCLYRKTPGSYPKRKEKKTLTRMEEEDKGHFHNCTHSKYHNLSKWKKRVIS